MRAVDILASEYGWSKREILEDVYFDEFLVLTKTIEKRKMAEYRMQLAIAQNPHSKNPKELWTNLQTEEASLRSAEFDEQGMSILKSKLASNPRIIVKE